MLIGSYDAHLYALDARTGQAALEGADQGQVHATPAVQDGLAFIAGCDAIFRAIRVTDGREMYQIDVRRLHRRLARSSTATAPTSAPSTTRCWRST